MWGFYLTKYLNITTCHFFTCDRNSGNIVFPRHGYFKNYITSEHRSKSNTKKYGDSKRKKILLAEPKQLTRTDKSILE